MNYHFQIKEISNYTLINHSKKLKLDQIEKFQPLLRLKSEIKLTCLMKPVTVKRWVNRLYQNNLTTTLGPTLMFQGQNELKSPK